MDVLVYATKAIISEIINILPQLIIGLISIKITPVSRKNNTKSLKLQR